MTAVDGPPAGSLGPPAPRRRPRTSRRGRRVLAGVAVAVAASAAFDIGHTAGGGDRASDLRGLVRTIDADVAACNSSLRDSYDAYAAVVAGQAGERHAAEAIIAGDEPGCTPAANSDLFDLSTTEAPATLRAYDVKSAVSAVGGWAFPNAAAAIDDLGTLLAHPATPAASAARRDLQARVAAMEALAASAQGTLDAAGRHLGVDVGALQLGAAGDLRAGGL